MDLKEITGIGEVRKKSLEESGIFSAEDLINYFPYKYYDFSKTEPYFDDGNVRLISATVIENPKIIKARTGLTMVTCKMNDEVGHTFNAVWYNQIYIKNNLFLGAEVYLYGKNSPSKKNTFVVMLSKHKDKLELGFLPVYRTISGIGQKILHDSINFVINKLNFSTIIPEKMLRRYNLQPLKNAYYELHNPLSEENVSSAIERIEIENLIPLIAVNEYFKATNKLLKNQKYNDTIKIKTQYEKLLPFNLTPEQNNAIYEIEKDLKSKFSMNRLLQGDVGSGKTVVAFYGAFLSACNGYQAVITAPTEILARQHYEFAKRIFENNDFCIELLTSSMTKLEKNLALENISSGKSKIIIGTHSVFSENVEFQNLSYIVIDEQHRFGVEQRNKLKQKGISPDILVMSATPIPRSMSLVIYGDLDLTTLNSRPKPQKITTNIVSNQKQNDMWNYIDNKIQNGSKVYVVCSKIDEDNDNDSVKKYSAKNMFDFLKTKFNPKEIALIHGKLSKEKQNDVIEKFRKGIINVLVSTTIIEVGVDIPEADIMVIATPERFGLATLHQLRGRVGRNGNDSYCFCLADNLNEKSYERIQFFKNHSNGFEIADYDLNNRGSGSILGTNQHGSDNGLFSKITSSIYGTAKEILEEIKKDSNNYYKVFEKGNKLYTEKILGKVIMN
ncbi:MAG: ATP-dependent DNA helicase RecG [Clostridia bacterium]|nr:ATP-dependent DNA helicase RecG [Clostridia bacterium]